jgi:hypothetical protein
MRRWIGAAGVLVVAVLVWWFAGRSPDDTSDADASRAPPRSPAPPSAAPVASTAPVASARGVRRLSPEQRQALRAQLEHARVAQPSAPSPALPATADSDDNAMGTVEQVLQQFTAVIPELRTEVAACQRYAPDAKGFTTKISLFGDADIGTLIDAPSALVPVDGPPLPAAFDDCVRDVLQTLELPPMHTGDQFTVAFEVSFTDDDSGSPDRR